MTIQGLLKLIHIITAIWMITGVIGRAVSLSKAQQSKDISSVRSILQVTAFFEQRMVIPGSAAVLLMGLIVAWAQGWPILGFLQNGTSNWVLVSLLLYLTIIPVISLILVPRGKNFAAALNASLAAGSVTPELSQAFQDPWVRAGRTYEVVLILLIVSLMVLKPF